MGLLAGLAWLRRRIKESPTEAHESRRLRRIGLCEPLESRRLMTGDPLPVHLGAVYFEDASGDDAVPDRIEVTFEGGAPGTQLTKLTIKGDKNENGKIDPAEVFFDTVLGGRGSFNPQPLKIVSHDGFEIVSMTVEDGSPTIVFELSGFEAGDKLVFTIDVDEQGSINSTAIAEGGEFEGSILEGAFQAPHYQDVSLRDIFMDDYTGKFTQEATDSGTTLNLPPDTYVPPSTNDRSDMTAGAANHALQPPLPITISGRVYEDHDLDNQQDAGDQGLSGVSLTLWKWDGAQYVATGKTATTNATGDYNFTGVLPGKYQVREAQPSGFISVGATAGTVGGATRGQVVSADVIGDIDLLGGDDSVRNDFAEARPASLSGHVYHDRNNNGVLDPGEEGIAGVSLQITGIQTLGNTPVSVAVVTNAFGYWEAPNLIPGTYKVVETQPTPYLDGLDRAGSAGGTPVNPGDEINGITLVSGTIATDYDFGELLPSSISGVVHADLDGDCAYDPGEPLLAGVTIELYAAGSDTPITTTTTDSQGRYKFDGLRPGTYEVRELQPAGYFDGMESVGTAGGVVKQNDWLGSITLVSGTVAEHYDFCEIPPSSIRGMVHADTNGNCVFDEGEQPLAGVKIELLDAEGNVIDTTTTDEHGAYAFENLAPGTYAVRESQPDGYLDGGENVGTAGGRIDVNDLIEGIVLTGGTQGEEYNFCEIPPASISGMIHADMNGDCLYDQGEPLLAGVQVDLLDAQGNVLQSTTTNANGEYRFDNLAPGTYGVFEHQPAGYFDSGERVGTAGGVLSADDTITQIALGAGVQAVDYDFCEALPSRIEGMVHIDLDGDCVLDPGEQPLPDVTIQLLDAQGNVIGTTTTDASGMYSFENLAPGKYGVRELQPTGYWDGGESVGTAGGQITANDQITGITLISATNGLHYDFCELLPNSLSGMVHVDLNGNCILDENEQPLSGVTIELLDEAGNVIRSTTTDEHGEYLFDNLPSGKYSIREVQPASYLDSGDSVGSLGGELAGNDLIKGIVLVSGNNGENYNFCETLPASLSGMVHVDLDGDCVFDPGEPPLPGVTIQLLDAAGNVVQTTVTDMHGAYRFDNLAPGNYGVREIQPAGFLDFGESVGTAGGEITGNDLITNIVLGPGVNAEEYDFCEQEAPVRIELVLPPPAPAAATVLYPAAPAYILPPPALVTPERPPLYGGSAGVVGYTWHLSVVDAGRPRGNDAGPRVAARLLRNVSVTGWDDSNLGQSEWQQATNTARQRQMFGMRGATPIVGDFNGDGVSEMGVFYKGEWYIDLNGNGVWDEDDLWAKLGHQDDKPVVGDWNGDGKTDIGIFGPAWPRDPMAVAKEPGLPDPLNPDKPEAKNLPPHPDRAASGVRELRRTARGEKREDLIDHVFFYGAPLDVPLVGDWNGDGIDTVAVFNGGQWYLDVDGDGKWSDGDIAFTYGLKGDKPVVGDWDGDGVDEVGVFRNGTWQLDTNRNHRLDPEDRSFQLGGAGDVPVVGDWNADGVDEPGVYIDGERLATRPASAATE